MLHKTSKSNLPRSNLRSLLLFVLSLLSNNAYANNGSYITLSNQIARNTQLEVIANNAANAGSIGFESDSVIFNAADKKQTSKRSNSFVMAGSSYKPEEQGGIKVTNRPLDLAIANKGAFFKILTPKGFRYTLNGSMLVSSTSTLVNFDGYPFLSATSGEIELPPNFQSINIGQDGIIYVDGEALETIGVFSIDDPNKLIKEGKSLYLSKSSDNVLNEFTIISGALRQSNVSSPKVMTELIELERSAQMTNKLMSNINEMEKSFINKIGK